MFSNRRPQGVEVFPPPWLACVFCGVTLLVAVSMPALALPPMLVQKTAQPVAVPTAAIGENTVLVAFVGVTRLSPADLRQSLQAVLLGPMAGALNPDPQPTQEIYDAVTKAGLQTATVLVNLKADVSEQPDAIVYLSLKGGSDPEALKQFFLSKMSAGAKAKAVFEQSGKFLTYHEKGVAVAAGGSADRAKDFTDALAASGGSPVVIAFMPNEPLRAHVLKEWEQAARGLPLPVLTVVPNAMQAKWATVSLNLGAAPNVILAIGSADEDSARKLLDVVNGGLDQLKEMNARRAGGTGPTAMAKFMVDFVDRIRPKQSGANISITLDAQTITLATTILLPSLSRARETANRIKCANNLSQIGKGCLIYANDHDGKYPPDLGVMVIEDEMRPGAYLCPSGDTTIPAEIVAGTREAKAAWVNQHSDFIYLGAGKNTAGVNRQTLIAYEKPNHHGDGMNMLFGDGHVEFRPTADAQRTTNEQKVKCVCF